MSEVEFCDLNILKEHASPFNKGMFRISSEYTEWGFFFLFRRACVFAVCGLKPQPLCRSRRKKETFLFAPLV